MSTFSRTRALSLRVLAGVAALALSGAALATATLAPGSTAGDPTGIDNLVVDGTTYDVTFSTTSFNSTFTAGTTASEDAADALAAALNQLGVTGLGGFTFPGDPDAGYFLGVEDDRGSAADGAFLTPPGGSWSEGPVGEESLGLNKTDEDNVAANFVAVGSTGVPEPGTLALFGLGLVGVALSRRRLAR